MKLLTNGTIICRTGWCDICAKENRPHTGQKFFAVGSTGKTYVGTADRIAPIYGFTPHLYRIKKAIGQNVVFETVCSMECSIEFNWNEKEYKWYAYIDDTFWVRGMMDLKDWNALVMYRRDKDYEV